MWFNICTVVTDKYESLSPILMGIKQNVSVNLKHVMWWVIVEKSSGVQKVFEELAKPPNQPPGVFESIAFPVVVMPKNGDAKNTFLNACNHGYVYFCDEDNYPHPFLVTKIKHHLYGPSYKVPCVHPLDDTLIIPKEYLGQYMFGRPDIGTNRFTMEDDFVARVEKGSTIVQFKDSKSFYRKFSV